MAKVSTSDAEHVELLHQLSLLHEQVGPELELHALYQQMLALLAEVAQAERAGILLVDPDGVLRFKAQRGLGEFARELENQLTWPRDAPDGPPVILPDQGGEQGASPSERIGTLVSFPLRRAHRLLGRVVVGYDKARRFDDATLQRLQLVVTHLGVALDHQLMESRLAQQGRDYEAILQSMGEGVVVQRADGQLLFVNDAAAALMGAGRSRAPALLLRHPVKPILEQLEITDEVGRRIPLNALPGSRALRGEFAEAQVYITLQELGQRKAVHVRAMPMFDAVGRVRQAVSVLRDVTDEMERAESLRRFQQKTEERIDRLGRLQRITSGLYQANQPEQVMQKVVADCADGFSAHCALLWLWNGAEQRLELQHLLGSPHATLAPFIHLDESHALMAAFRRSEPAILTPEQMPPGFPSASIFACLPVMVKGEVVGLLVLGFAQPKRFRRMDHALFAAVGEQIGLAIERTQLFESERKARAEAEAAGRRAAFLADASALLVKSQLLEEALPPLARLAVAELADWCEVLLVDDHDELVTAAECFAEQLSPEVRAASPRPLALRDGAHARVWRTGRAEFFPAEPAEPRFRALGMRSGMVVPMRARGRVVGTMTLGSFASHAFHHQDLALVEALADRAALAVDNFRLFQQAHDSLRAREHVLSILSHDVRVPLGQMQMKAQQLRRRLPTHSPLRTYVDAILSAGWATNDMIRDLLDVAALQRGEWSVRPSPVPLKQLLSEVFQKFSESKPSRSLHTALSPDVAEAVVMCERVRVGQVFSNLLENAFRSTPQDGSVTVRARRVDEQVQFAIQDGGPGIPPEALPHLFRQYWKAGPEVSAVGLGLFIAKELVEAHRGEIRVHSQFGEGTTVLFTLPLALH